MIHLVDIDRPTCLSRGVARNGDAEAALPFICDDDDVVGGWLALAEKYSR
jgi:hypothetical protein